MDSLDEVTTEVKMFADGYLRMFLRQPLFLVAVLISVCAEMGLTATIAVVPLYLKDELKTSALFAGTVVSAFAVAETLFKTPSGVLSDRLGRKRMVFIGLAVGMASTLVMGTIKHSLPFLFLHAFNGLAAAILWVSLAALFIDLASHDQRAAALGLINLCYLIGLVIGPAIGLRMWHHFDSGRFSFWFTSTILALTLLVALVLLPSRKLYRLGSADPVQPVQPKGTIRREILELNASQMNGTLSASTRLRLLWPVGLVLGLVQFGVSLHIPVLPLYAEQRLQMSKAEMSNFVFATAVVLALMALPLSRLGDRLNRISVIQVGLLTAAVGMATAPWLRTFPTLLTLAVVMGGTWAAAAPALLALTSDLAAKQERGSAVGLVTTGQGIGFCIGPFIGSLVWEQVSPVAPFYTSALALGVATVVSLLLGKSLAQVKAMNKAA